MAKPFDSKVQWRRDDDEPVLEFEYRGTRMGPQQMVGFILTLSFAAVPFAAIPFAMSRRKNRIRIDAFSITVEQYRRWKWHSKVYPRDHVSRVRTQQHSMNNQGPGQVAQIVFDYGTKRVVLFQCLSEPELLWMHNEVQSFISRHWAVEEEPARL